jgi:hypothetical protein
VSKQSLSQRATRAWRAAGLEPIGLHECRHTIASLMIAAGVNAKARSTFRGHAFDTEKTCKSCTSAEGGFEPSVDRKAHNGFRGEGA